MREMFVGYYTPTPDQFKKLWEKAVFTFDANILLNIYRYSPKTTEILFKIIKQFGKRIWVSHQAALEYQQNRLQVISDQIAVYSETTKTLKEIGAKAAVVNRRHHPFLDTGGMIEKVREFVEKISKEIDQAKADHPDYLPNDPLREELTNLLKGKVGQPYTREDLQRIYKDGEQRYKEKIPPGYDDQREKTSPDYFGDLVLWRQLLDYGKEQNGKAIILVTDETKEDWWTIHRGKTIGPRPELIHEMLSVAKSPFYLYSGDQFLQHALQFLGEKIDIVAADQAKAIEEAKDVRKSTLSIPAPIHYYRLCKRDFNDFTFRWQQAYSEDRTDTAMPANSLGHCGNRLDQFYKNRPEWKELISPLLLGKVGRRMLKTAEEDFPNVDAFWSAGEQAIEDWHRVLLEIRAELSLTYPGYDLEERW